jgi:hypothetical protein
MKAQGVLSLDDTLLTYYSYCNTHRIHNFGKQRLVITHGSLIFKVVCENRDRAAYRCQPGR